MIQKFLGTIVKTRVVENLGAKARKYENISKLWSLNTCQFPKQQFKISNSLRLSLDSYFYCQHRNASNRIVFLQKDGAWKIKDLTILIKDRDFLLFSCFCQKGIRCVLSNCLIAPQFQKKKKHRTSCEIVLSSTQDFFKYKILPKRFTCDILAQ